MEDDKNCCHGRPPIHAARAGTETRSGTEYMVTAREGRDATDPVPTDRDQREPTMSAFVQPQWIEQRYRHEPDHGFCLVCGGVWPCWGAQRLFGSRKAAGSRDGMGLDAYP